jgi:hypothetical protein
MRWLSARRWNLWNSSVLRRRCSGTAAGAGQDGTTSGAPVDLTRPPVMTLPKHLGDIREPHPVHCHIHTRQTSGSILTCPNEPSKRGAVSHWIYAPINRWTESDVLDPMFEKPQKAHVVRIKIEAVSLHSASIAPLLMDRFRPALDNHATGTIRP